MKETKPSLLLVRGHVRYRKCSCLCTPLPQSLLQKYEMSGSGHQQRYNFQFVKVLFKREPNYFQLEAAASRYGVI